MNQQKEQEQKYSSIVEYFQRVSRQLELDDGCESVESLMTGKLLHQVLMSTNHSIFTPITQNTISQLNQQVNHYYSTHLNHYTDHIHNTDDIDVLDIVLQNNIQEFIRLVERVLRIMIESNKRDIFIEIILDMTEPNQQQMKDLVQKIIRIEDTPRQQDKQVFLDKIDELEQENNQLQEQLKHNEHWQQQHTQQTIQIQELQLKIEHLQTKEEHMRNTLQQQSYDTHNQLVHQQISQLEQEYKHILTQKQQDNEDLALQLEQLQAAHQTLLKHKDNQAKAERKGGEDKLQEMVEVYRVEQESIRQEQREQLDTLRQQILNHQNTHLQQEVQLGAYKAQVLQLQQQLDSCRKALSRKQQLIDTLQQQTEHTDQQQTEHIYQQQIEHIYQQQIEHSTTHDAIHSNLQTNLQNNNQQDNHTFIQEPSLTTQLAKSTHLYFNELEDNHKELQEKEEQLNLKEKSLEEKEQKLLEQENQLKEKELQLQEQHQNLEQQSQELSEYKQKMNEQEQKNKVNEHQDDQNIIQKLKADVEKYRKNCEVIKRIKTKEIQNKDQELKFLVNVLYDLRTRFNEKGIYLQE